MTGSTLAITQLSRFIAAGLVAAATHPTRDLYRAVAAPRTLLKSHIRFALSI
ncbi:hypothetical protein PC116_g26142 [Phytophthora cactorum]|uniref:Uncharacterized protein n=1 Tax=Phytophthora cactorum TaxID=29920 RepID=A0A8T1F5M9_9STRA|nr:hypothetical protein Pcac1_g11826 [Phytophthora cactorum]KAG2797497.1 hypothetical protein PC111_g21270 [Phytophthora cactorum]KAG2962365.1 hypothetical protein PC118_g21461 [Phytophthora cactorum]KAG2970823.1 hypothetical protein PC119_g23548 [Phytophthora cactorum]KAG2986868.1 hypothetical protein PC120_g23737 [Phytophthora cactorum]